MSQLYSNGKTNVRGGDNGNYDKAILCKHTCGINNFNVFQTPTDVFIVNIGGNDYNKSGLGKPVPFIPNRGAWTTGARGIDYDPIINRLWVTGANLKPNNFSTLLDTNGKYDMSIFAMYSDDGGNSWSPQI
jgi:hypothetical protein